MSRKRSETHLREEIDPVVRDLVAALSFRSAAVAAACCRTTSIPLTDSTAWRLVDGILRHRTGRFFAVAALADSGRHPAQPILLQPEIGTLGFLRTVSGGQPRFLCHAKVEPGNVGDAQFAPTCQATLSNLERMHGGEPPPYADAFLMPEPLSRRVADSLQSEQGTRFLGKRNRNLILDLPPELADDLPVSGSHAWLPGPLLQDLLLTDYAVNTDARSVLVSADWRLISASRPFASRSGNVAVAAGLAASYAAPDGTVEAAGARRLLTDLRRAAASAPPAAPLAGLRRWHPTVEGWEPEQAGRIAIRHLAVSVHGREVPAWDQPFICCDQPGEVLLVSAEVAGVWRFLVHAREEPALPQRVELTPAVCIGPGDIPEPNEEALRATCLSDGIEQAAVWQSEEGGRFFRNRVRYRWLHLQKPLAIPADHLWLSLAALQELACVGGHLTNEARSALALVLAHV